MTEFQATQAREMRIAAGVLARHAMTDPDADRARGLASTIVGLISGGWGWDDLVNDATKAAAVMGAYVALRWAREAESQRAEQVLALGKEMLAQAREKLTPAHIDGYGATP